MEEEAHCSSTIPTVTQRTRAVSSNLYPPAADDSDDDLLGPVNSQYLPLETEDDDEPLLQFDETGVGWN